MGCDIHMVLEKRFGEKWVGIDTFVTHHRAPYTVEKGQMDWSTPVARGRNYMRFARLAGVRGDGPEPRGLPADVSETSKALSDAWDGDGHSHSWLPLKDAARIWVETEREPSEYATKYPESYFFNADVSDGSSEAETDYRVVFWFDN